MSMMPFAMTFHNRLQAAEGRDYFTERSGTERNWGLKYGMEHIWNDRIGIGLTTHGDSSTALAQLHCNVLRS